MFPCIFVLIYRPKVACVRATGIDGAVFEAEGSGLFARAMLHEYDHLTGKLLVDFVGPLKKRQIKRKLEKEGGGHVHGEHCDHDHDDHGHAHDAARGGRGGA